jgi:hypothetical protein
MSTKSSRPTLSDLLDAVLERHTKPENVDEMTALLESMGWSDARAKLIYGFSDVFELAVQLWALYRDDVQYNAHEEPPQSSLSTAILSYVRQFLRGIIFAFPMLLSIVSMLTLHFSLWSYEYVSEKYATAIAIGTILSFVSVGGFMQSIARRAFFYIFQGYYNMARRATFRFIRVGVTFSLSFSVLLYFLDVLFPILPYDMLTISIAFYLVLNSIWLSVTTMYILKSEFIFTGLLALGIGLVYVLFVWLHLNILAAQLIAMVVVAVLSILIVMYLFRRAERREDKGIRAKLPRTGVTVFSVSPYFVYGTLYFLLLFTDRVMAWTTYNPFSTYVIWFRGDYEIGLDFALVMLLIPMGVSEVLVSRMMNSVGFSQRHFRAVDSPVMNGSYVKSFWYGYAIMGVVSILSAIGDYFAVKWLVDAHQNTIGKQIIMTHVTNYVFVLGLISYMILGAALLNAVIMFSLSRPDQVIRPLAFGVLANFVAGFLASRWFAYYDAVWGLLAGVTIFLILTTISVRKVLLHTDYHLYLLS